jgi:hypothetical protein
MRRIIRHYTLNCNVCDTFNYEACGQDTSIVNVNVQKESVIPGSNQHEYLEKIMWAFSPTNRESTGNHTTVLPLDLCFSG